MQRFERNDKELVHDALLEVMNDPENYSLWQHEFIESLEFSFENGEQMVLSEKQKTQVLKILEDR